ncbi:MAG: aldehyde ferredoxin oxidoreductase family protein [Anaerolineaceae bacterium]|nr:aldehyde ferredoxin oxidoreductase family protein [Anaerolineaceae bacterium]
MYGYSGKILHIDLKTKKNWVENKPEEWYKLWIGGVSMASRLLWENIVPGCDPLDDGNPICFANGIFTGTPVPVGGKFGLASKSPLTGFIGDSLSGSWFSIALKRAGWDGMVLHNSCDKWTQLFVDDNRVQFNDATYLLGKGTFETEEAIREKLGDDQIRSCTIGPCGENLVRYANVTNDGRQAGRTGHGMLWGHKKLKAVSVRGTHGVKVFDPAALNQLSFDISKSAQGKDTEKYRVFGTATGMLSQNKAGVLPTRNFQEGVYEDAEMVSGEYLDVHHKVKVIACAQCPIACEQMSIVNTGPFAGAMTGIEYESLFANSSNLGINDMRAAIKLITIADHDGMDTVTMGVTIGYAMECYEKGVLTDKDFVCASHPEGFSLYFGDGDSAVKLAEMIRDREGIGDLMAEGVRIASQTIDKERGSESWKWAMHIKGLEPAGYDSRSLKTFAVGLATGTRGGCHNRSAAYDPDIKGETNRLTVDETRGRVAADSEEYAAVYDSLPLCKFIRRSFTGKADRAGAWPAIAKLINATTGWDYDYDDVDLIGIHATNIKKAFNIREGWTEKDDELPWRWKHDKMTMGPGAGVVVSDEELEYMKQLYYKAKNWNEEGLIPKEFLIQLGMPDVAEEIGV